MILHVESIKLLNQPIVTKEVNSLLISLPVNVSANLIKRVNTH